MAAHVVHTSGNLFYELCCTVTAVHKHVSPGRQLFGGINLKNMGLHPFSSPTPEDEGKFGIHDGGGLPWS